MNCLAAGVLGRARVAAGAIRVVNLNIVVSEKTVRKRNYR